jgi:uncharacterized membrane protein
MESKMKKLRNYYISRAAVALVFGSLFYLIGSPWWAAVMAGLIALAGFAWAPHSGRYLKQVQANGQVQLSRDENTRAIADRAGRNGFITTMIALAGVLLYFWWSGDDSVPLDLLMVVVMFGILTFAISDVMIRRRGFHPVKTEI